MNLHSLDYQHRYSRWRGTLSGSSGESQTGGGEGQKNFVGKPTASRRECSRGGEKSGGARAEMRA